MASRPFRKIIRFSSGNGGLRHVAGVALGSAAVGGPVHEALQAIAVFPGEAEKFAGGKIVRFPAEECFKPPAEVGALPGLKAIASCNDPVVAQRSKHCSAFCSRSTPIEGEVLLFQECTANCALTPPNVSEKTATTP
jgi:hypothetical protein